MKRFLSLDILRGLTVACMIMVNNPGSWGNIFPPLKHAAWDGCTPTDLVFPFFLFVVGAAIWFSNRKTEHKLTSPVVTKIVKRGLLIFAVGLLLNWYPFYNKSFFDLRLLGVLQRIGIAFAVGAVVALWLGTYKRIIIGLLSIVVGYWIIVCAFGDYTIENYIGRYVDLALLGEGHLYKGFGMPFDPEGLLNTLPAIGTVLLGYMSGKLMGESGDNPLRGILTLGVAGGLLVTLGLIINPYFPINKALWSTSYVFYAGGLAMQVWAVLAFFIDYQKKTKWTTFFNVFGTNALFSFVLSGFLVKTWGMPIFKFTVGEKSYTVFSYLYANLAEWTTPKFGSFVCALVMVLICWGLTYLLYRKKIYIKL